MFLVAHAGGGHEMVYLYLPSLPNLAASAPSHSPSHPRYPLSFPQGSHQHYAYAHCQQIPLSGSGMLCSIVLAGVVAPLEGKQEIPWGLGDFIFEEILCRWGGIAEIVTD